MRIGEAGYANAVAGIDQFDSVVLGLFAKQQYWSANGKVDEVVARILKPAQLKQARSMVNDPMIASAIDGDIALGRRGL